MIPAIQTEHIHTINFYSTSFQIEHNLAGLDKLVCEHSKHDINFHSGSLHNTTIHNTLEHIMPEVLDQFSCQRLEEIYKTGLITLPDLRLLVQWLVNKEVLPSGTYKIIF